MLVFEARGTGGRAGEGREGLGVGHLGRCTLHVIVDHVVVFTNYNVNVFILIYLVRRVHGTVVTGLAFGI